MLFQSCQETMCCDRTAASLALHQSLSRHQSTVAVQPCTDAFCHIRPRLREFYIYMDTELYICFYGYFIYIYFFSTTVKCMLFLYILHFFVITQLACSDELGFRLGVSPNTNQSEPKKLAVVAGQQVRQEIPQCCHTQQDRARMQAHFYQLFYQIEKS